ncbi:MurR/RpiR family transcriptional regulator [Salisediminibacterium halotolerans]|uniref:MurR/RpiR family transcriptional regulator n=1 Tax=Salisediminibacterium halotolerans TaxID=517425 RepID=UPI000EB38A45|nr:MurR/RpiR family transcriptional regulator [Salisediminibacterium halotolerans]RLJ73204.1 RpiR family transcriptional regulator [Actinophytocola xinjiangensis]RPE86626.1 RpiR family transcriptional regulator [Salisediminibacterium halotolerans]TWG34001.1 RpiR family transcriptional regulator [Salisediminibacterium halotolerans]GEL06592.1 RpiR family transcriptional regulator [Salisediminibacterium halotolerans]
MNTSETTHVKHRIRSSYDTFREKEKLVADYILQHPDVIVHSTISQVAEELQVAEATVFRFCKRLGFKGYQAMKIALASEVVQGIQNIHETIQEGDDVKMVAEKVFQSNTRTLEETFNVLDKEMFTKAVEMMSHARRIEFYGNGGSGVIALDAHHKFMRTGIPTIAYSDSHFQMMSASQLTENDTAVLISHSGSNRDMLQVADVANERGANTIGITNLGKSPLSERVDVSLFTVSEETDYRSEALASRLAQLTLIDALFVNVSIVHKEKMEDVLINLRKAISVKRV